ncbi:MAG: hypothetical protein Q8M02_10565 [Candidatus Didemnitutus sp.]|nr:hypothetical protein [Candidatus Didemnitutus sp.]
MSDNYPNYPDYQPMNACTGSELLEAPSAVTTTESGAAPLVGTGSWMNQAAARRRESWTVATIGVNVCG